MPILNHLNLPVADVGAFRDLLVHQFGFRVLASRGKDAFVLLEGDDGFVLTLMRARPADAPAFPANLHIGFRVETPELVRVRHAELVAAGLQPGPVEEITRGGIASVTFYCDVPGAVLIEVTSGGG